MKRTTIIGIVAGLMISFIPKVETYEYAVELNRAPIVVEETVVEETMETSTANSVFGKGHTVKLGVSSSEENEATNLLDKVFKKEHLVKLGE